MIYQSDEVEVCISQQDEEDVNQIIYQRKTQKCMLAGTHQIKK